MWPELQDLGWTQCRGKGLISWYYARPNIKVKNGILGTDFFSSEDDVIDFFESNHKHVKPLENDKESDNADIIATDNVTTNNMNKEKNPNKLIKNNIVSSQKDTNEDVILPSDSYDIEEVMETTIVDDDDESIEEETLNSQNNFLQDCTISTFENGIIKSIVIINAEEAKKRMKQLSPIKRPNGKQTSDIWKSIILLKYNDNRRLNMINKVNATHVCFYCEQLFGIAFRTSGISGCYLTTQAARHLKMCNKGGQEAISQMSEKVEKNKKKRKLSLIKTIDRVTMYEGKFKLLTCCVSFYNVSNVY